MTVGDESAIPLMAREHAVLGLGVLAASFAAIFVRLAEAPALVVAACRLSLACVVLAPVALTYCHRELARLTGRSFLLMLASGALLALHFALWISSLSYTTVASSVVLVTVNPVFVAIASYLLFDEPVGRRVILGVVVCLSGAVLIGYGDWALGQEPLRGDILAFSGALAIAGYFLIGRALRQGISVLSYAFVVYVSAAVFLLLAVWAWGYSLLGYSRTTYLMCLLLALVPQLLGHMSLNWALRFVPATLVTVAILGEPVAATGWARLILNETPTLSQVVGGALILSGIGVAFWKRKVG